MVYLILEDIRSHIRKRHIYAVKGTKVKVISKSGNVLIVEDANGNRFAVMEDKVKNCRSWEDDMNRK